MITLDYLQEQYDMELPDDDDMICLRCEECEVTGDNDYCDHCIDLITHDPFDDE